MPPVERITDLINGQDFLSSDTMRRRGMTIFWPQYFDKMRPIRLGRRIAVIDGTEKPSTGDLSAAAQKLKYHIEIDKLSKYPRSPWDDAGMVMIDTMGQKKSAVVHRLAPEVKQARITRLEQAKLKKVKKKKKKKQQNIDLLKQKIAQRQSKKK